MDNSEDRGGLTEYSKPASHRPVHLIQDEDDHQVNDGGGGFYRQPNIGACGGVGAHVQGGFGGDPVQDDSKHNSKGDHNLIERTCM